MAALTVLSKSLGDGLPMIVINSDAWCHEEHDRERVLKEQENYVLRWRLLIENQCRTLLVESFLYVCQTCPRVNFNHGTTRLGS